MRLLQTEFWVSEINLFFWSDRYSYTKIGILRGIVDNVLEGDTKVIDFKLRAIIVSLWLMLFFPVMTLSK